jgi:hypothetical protein
MPPLTADQTELVAGDGRLRPPTPVLVSFWIWVVSAVLTVIAALITLTEHDAILDTVRQHPPAGLQPDQYDSYVQTLIVTTLITAVVLGALDVFFAIKVRAGRNWARLVLTILTVLFGLYDLTSGASLATLISVVVSLVAVVLLYVPRSRDFFAAGKSANR